MTKRADLVPLDTIDLTPFDRWLSVKHVDSVQRAVAIDEAHLAVCALYDAADERRKALKEPFLRGCQHYDAQWRKARRMLEQLRDHLAKLLSDFEYAQRKEAIAKAVRVTKRMQDKERAVALVRLAELDSIPLPHGKWIDAPEIKVLDWTAVPQEFLQLNETAVKKCIRDGVTDIPGLRIVIRRKRSARA